MILALPPGRADIWILPTTPAPAADVLAACRRLLSEDERARADRFHFERDRTTFLLSHALTRSVLSRYAEVTPAAWRFRTNDHGCPFVAQSGHGWLRFNLTHTDGCAAIVVARDSDVGIDVESLARPPVDADVARRYFAAGELEVLLRTPEPERHRVFLEFWTLKEAYIKARAVGLSLGLHDFTCTRGAGGRASIAFTAAIADDPAAWHLEQFTPSPSHTGAVAVRRHEGRAVAIDVRRLDARQAFF